jgi:hypothetical protein
MKLLAAKLGALLFAWAEVPAQSVRVYRLDY